MNLTNKLTSNQMNLFTKIHQRSLSSNHLASTDDLNQNN